MSGPLILIVGAIYAAIAIEQFWKGSPGMGIAFAGYAFSNAGLWALAR